MGLHTSVIFRGEIERSELLAVGGRLLAALLDDIDSSVRIQAWSWISQVDLSTENRLAHLLETHLS